MTLENSWGAHPVEPHEQLAEKKFIGVEHGAHGSQGHQITIRSQVMLDFYKKQPLQDVHHEASVMQSHRGTPFTPRAYMGRFRVGPSESQKRRAEARTRKRGGLKTRPIQPRMPFPFPATQAALHSALTEPEDLLSQYLVPLMVVPEGNPHRIRALTHHYCEIPFAVVTYTSLTTAVQERKQSSQLMLHLRKGYFQLALQDSAFFSAAISHYAGILSLATRDGDPTESLQLRMRSITIVNSRLREPTPSISDGTLGAVASIINYETNNGTPLAVQVHLTGLKAMLQLRGGFFSARLSPLLQRMIAWAELTAAYFLSVLPTIIPFDSPGLDMPPRISHISPYLKSQSLAATISATSTYNIDWQVIDKNQPSIFADLRFLSRALASQEIEISMVDPYWYSDKIYLVQRSLIYLVMCPEPHHTALDIACCITASLYVDRRLRDLGTRSVAVNTTVSKLRAFMPQVLEKLPQHSESEVTIDRVLWILVFAGIAANGRPERTWFVQNLAIMCQIHKVKSWYKLTTILDNILWDEEWEVPYGLLWAEVKEVYVNKGFKF